MINFLKYISFWASNSSIFIIIYVQYGGNSPLKSTSTLLTKNKIKYTTTIFTINDFQPWLFMEPNLMQC